jgi:hypothetical protein
LMSCNVALTHVPRGLGIYNRFCRDEFLQEGRQERGRVRCVKGDDRTIAN